MRAAVGGLVAAAVCAALAGTAIGARAGTTAPGAHAAPHHHEPWSLPEGMYEARLMQSPDTPRGTRTAGQPILDLARGPHSGVEQPTTAVARNTQEFQAIWAKLPMRRALPQVAFDTTMVAAVFLGSRPSAGYGVEVVKATREGDTLVIQYAERTPSEGSVNADVITTPYALAGVPLTTGAVRFEKVQEARP
jgi:hypothetical protein